MCQNLLGPLRSCRCEGIASSSVCTNRATHRSPDGATVLPLLPAPAAAGAGESAVAADATAASVAGSRRQNCTSSWKSIKCLAC